MLCSNFFIAFGTFIALTRPSQVMSRALEPLVRERLAIECDLSAFEECTECACACVRAHLSRNRHERARRRRRCAVTRRPRHWLCVSAALRLCRCVTQFPRTGVERQQQSVQHHSTNLRGAAARVLTLTYICWPTKQKKIHANRVRPSCVT